METNAPYDGPPKYRATITYTVKFEADDDDEAASAAKDLALNGCLPNEEELDSIEIVREVTTIKPKTVKAP